MLPKLRNSTLLFLAGLCLLASTACLPQAQSLPWVYADLRWLGPLSAPTPATDIVAVYTHAAAMTVDIRIDLLDINPGDEYLIRLSLWDNRGFSREPLQVEISSTGASRVSEIGNGSPIVWPRIVQNFDLDTVTISFNRALIGEHYRFQVSTFTTDPVTQADETALVRSDGQPPVQSAPVLLEFWSTFPAVTPAQALREWDGAHTGPLGARHGLKHVLDGAGLYHVPVALLDIKTPASLAALSYLDDLWQVQEMGANGLLILPDVAFSEPAPTALGFSRQAVAGFDVTESQFVYSVSQDPIPGYRARFVSLPDASHLAREGATLLIPLASPDVLEATETGPALEVRRALVAAMVSPDPTDLVVLGGSLPDSTWGEADMAAPTFAWIAAHPWIRPLDGQALLAFPIAKTVNRPSRPASNPSALLKSLESVPDNPIGRSAWQLYLTLTAPVQDPTLQALRADYLGQVNELIVAAAWAGHPTDRADCSQDLDADAGPDCILSNRHVLAILDPAGCQLTNLFTLDQSGPHQLVGPSSQFAVGLSDPSEWQPGAGQAADPSVINGAFADDDKTWVVYDANNIAGSLKCTGMNGGMTKTYRLTESGITVHYQGLGPASSTTGPMGLTTTRIPLVLDPQVFYSGPTRYRPATTPTTWTWSLAGGISVQVRSDVQLTGEGFVSSLPFLSMPEDPNLDYPSGHYLPFPLSLVTVQARGNFNVDISTVPTK